MTRASDSLLRPTSVALGTKHQYSYSYDTAGRLAAVTSNALHGSVPQTGTHTYSYLANAPQLLESVTSPAHTVTNVYETNRNVLDTKRNEKNSDGSVISAYDYAVNAIGQRERVDRSGSALRSNATHESVLNYPTYDGNGNVSEYLDFTGTPVAHYQYNAFGNTIDSKTTGSKASDFAHRFSTKPLDTENGFYYYGYRYYNPVTGTWPSRDPLGEIGHETVKLHMDYEQMQYLNELKLEIMLLEADLSTRVAQAKSGNPLASEILDILDDIDYLDELRGEAKESNMSLLGEAEFLAEGPSLYAFLANDSLNYIDVLGEQRGRGGRNRRGGNDPKFSDPNNVTGQKVRGERNKQKRKNRNRNKGKKNKEGNDDTLKKCLAGAAVAGGVAICCLDGPFPLLDFIGGPMAIGGAAAF